MRTKTPAPPESTITKIARAPARLAMKAVSLLSMHMTSWWQGITGSWRDARYETLAEKGMANPLVKRAYDLIWQNLASVPLLVQFEKMVNGKAELKDDPDHEILKVLRRPNQGASWRQFCAEMISDLFFGGELFFYAPGSPITGTNAGKPGDEGLHLLRPYRVTEIVRREEDDVITGYRYRNRKGIESIIPAGRIRHLKLFNPLNDERGYPLLLAAWRQVQLMEEGDDWNKSMAENRGRQPGFFNYIGGGRFNDDQWKRTKEEMQESFRKDAEKSRPGFLDGQWDYKPAATTQKDADWLEGDKLAALKVACALGIPARLLLDLKSGSLTDAGINSEMKALFLLTIIPLLEWLLADLNAHYMPMYGREDRTLTWNEDQVDALAEDQNAKYRRLLDALKEGGLSINEFRGETGWDARSEDEADELYIPIGRQPLVGTEEVDVTSSAGGDGAVLPAELAEMPEAEWKRLISSVRVQ